MAHRLRIQRAVSERSEMKEVEAMTLYDRKCKSLRFWKECITLNTSEWWEAFAR